MSKIATFTSFAAEDANMRDLFVGQSRHPGTPWEITDYSLHEPFTEKWKTQTRPRIARSKVLVVLIGSTTYRAEGALWEIKCAHEEGVPVVGVWISKFYRGPAPAGIPHTNVIEWTWDGIAAKLRSAAGSRITIQANGLFGRSSW